MMLDYDCSGQLVLLVDDEPIVTESVSDILEVIGIETLVAHNGMDAVDYFRDNQHNIDFIFLDLSMPGMDGVETFEQLRQINPDVVIVISSGHSEGETYRRLNGNEPNGFIWKPFDVTGLLTTIQELPTPNRVE